MERAISEALKNLTEFRAQINTGEYGADLSKCLVSFGIKGIISPLFARQVEETLLPDVSTFNPKTVENLLYFLSKVSKRQQSPMINALLQQIQQE